LNSGLLQEAPSELVMEIKMLFSHRKVIEISNFQPLLIAVADLPKLGKL
jgi:hypothetical protein